MSKNEDYGFDTEFMTDEEVEQMLDSIVTSVGDVASDDNSRTSVVNIYKMQQVLYVYKVMKYLAKGQKGVKVDTPSAVLPTEVANQNHPDQRHRECHDLQQDADIAPVGEKAQRSQQGVHPGKRQHERVNLGQVASHCEKIGEKPNVDGQNRTGEPRNKVVVHLTGMAIQELASEAGIHEQEKPADHHVDPVEE